MEIVKILVQLAQALALTTKNRKTVAYIGFFAIPMAFIPLGVDSITLISKHFSKVKLENDLNKPLHLGIMATSNALSSQDLLKTGYEVLATKEWPTKIPVVRMENLVKNHDLLEEALTVYSSIMNVNQKKALYASKNTISTMIDAGIKITPDMATQNMTMLANDALKICIAFGERKYAITTYCNSARGYYRDGGFVRT